MNNKEKNTMSNEEIKNLIESGLCETDINRIWILLKSTTLRGDALISKINEWKLKLITKEHIMGTPWNISEKDKIVLQEQFTKVFIK